MKQPCLRIFTLLLILLLSACSAGASTVPGSTTAAQTGETTGAAASASTPVISAQAVLTDAAGTHADADDYVVDLASAVSIAFNGDSIDASGSGVSVSGTTVTITAPGDYHLTGTLDDGQVLVNSIGDGEVRLVLDGVRLNNSTTSPLYIMDADEVILLLAEGTQNSVTDAASYVYPAADVDEPNAAIYSAADLSIAGTGALAVTGNFNDGLNSKDGLVIASGAISVTAADDGIRAKDYLLIHDGALTIRAGGDGLKSDNAEDAALGYIAIAGGAFNITAGGDGLSAQTTVVVTGGTFAITTGGGAGNSVTGEASAKGIKAGGAVTIAGGSFAVDSADDALHSNGSVTVDNGVLQLATSDDGVHADQALTINGGELSVTQSYEGLESAVITINGGTIQLASSDDGVNVAGGTEGQGMQWGGPGANADQDAAAYSGAYHLYINGGTLFVDAQGDGIDVGGAIEMTGGVVLVNGPTENTNGPLDFDAGFNMTGGFFVATGSAGMAQTAGTASTQNAVMVYLSATQPGGTPVAVVDANGRLVFAFTPTRAYQSIAFSSPELVTGQTYTLHTGGSVSGAATGGLVEDGSYTPGTQAASLTISSVVTQSGTGGGFPGGRPGRRP